MPRLWAVSINGADVFDDKPGWDHYIQPLDKGSFDVGGLLRTLKELGYKGPVGLQCYGIGGDTREHLARSMAAWRKLSENLGPDAIDAEIARLKQAGYPAGRFPHPPQGRSDDRRGGRLEPPQRHQATASPPTAD